MAHKCFISYKKEDQDYRNALLQLFSLSDVINKSLDRRINSYDGNYVMQVIRDDYLKDSTVTIFLIGTHSSENEGYDFYGDKNYFIKRELQASLFSGRNNTRNGILGVVLPSMYEEIYQGSYYCSTCGCSHNTVNITDETVIREFSANYYLEPHNGCSWSEDERYCVLVKWSDFINNPEFYINKAFEKRNAPVAQKVKIYNLRESKNYF